MADPITEQRIEKGWEILKNGKPKTAKKKEEKQYCLVFDDHNQFDSDWRYKDGTRVADKYGNELKFKRSAKLFVTPGKEAIFEVTVKIRRNNDKNDDFFPSNTMYYKIKYGDDGELIYGGLYSPTLNAKEDLKQAVAIAKEQVKKGNCDGEVLKILSYVESGADGLTIKSSKFDDFINGLRNIFKPKMNRPKYY